MKNILPCPACGDRANAYDYQAMSAVYCEDCGVRGPLGETEAEAIEQWNAMPRRLQIPTDLRQRIRAAIAKPVCERCQFRAEWRASECLKHHCQQLYEQETDAVMEIFTQLS